MSKFTEKNIIKGYCGHEDIIITKEDIEQLKSGKKLYTTVQDEYTIALKYKEESEAEEEENETNDN